MYEQVDVTGLSRDVSTRCAAAKSATSRCRVRTSRAACWAFDETIRGRVERGEIRLVAISPETGNAVRELGLPVAAEATTFTEDGLIEAVVELAERVDAK